MRIDKLILFVASIITCTSINAQNSSRDSIRQHLDSIAKEVDRYRLIDYLNYDYKYLDDDFNITMSSETFDSLIVTHNFYKERILKYKDSISVVLREEFESEIQQRVAKGSLTMSWLRVSYYLWISESESERLGQRYSFRYPYELYEYMYYRQNEWDKYMKRFIKNMKRRVYNETKNDEIYSMTTQEIFGYALKTNPTRIRDFKRVLKERRGIE